jgi:hypothetical protein
MSFPFIVFFSFFSDAIKQNIAFNPLLELIKKKISKFATRSTQVAHLTKPTAEQSQLNNSSGSQHGSGTGGTVPGTGIFH